MEPRVPRDRVATHRDRMRASARQLRELALRIPVAEARRWPYLILGGAARNAIAIVRQPLTIPERQERLIPAIVRQYAPRLLRLRTLEVRDRL
jgi:hypothetical protein